MTILSADGDILTQLCPQTLDSRVLEGITSAEFSDGGNGWTYVVASVMTTSVPSLATDTSLINSLPEDGNSQSCQLIPLPGPSPLIAPILIVLVEA